ncbi:MAG TPA: thymidine phosphorylase [Longimicrobiales bacterium]|nr:thymidine phosphorylase [Longimicrobiales bacterium]
MRPYGLILRKRDDEELPGAALWDFLRAYDAGEVPEYQMSAFLMAVFFRGMTPRELDVLVDVILGSGRTVDFSGAPGRRVDKHSTGGVGDKVSLVLAPLVASLGVQVPMMSGRGLGHSGGTVDKLEAIPGFRMDLPLDRFRAQVLELGIALITQTREIAPLDGKLYALRDVTGTVESIPLIAASIMSKKIAEGIDGLVLDIKTGNGAFLPEEDRAIELARTMIAIGSKHDLDVVALVTAMDRPLGMAVGNALELAEAVDALRGGGPADLREVTVALAAEMLVLGRVVDSAAAGRARAAAALDDGRALAMMRRVVEAQGGEVGVIDDPSTLPAAPLVRTVRARSSGRVEAMNTRAIGEAAVALGAGRSSLEDQIDPRVGFVLRVGLGDVVEEGAPLGEVHAASDVAAEQAERELRAAIRIGFGEVVSRRLVSHRVTTAGVERLD